MEEMEAKLEEFPRRPLSRNQWIAIGAAVLVAAAFAYGLTQLSFQREREKTQLLVQQYNEQKQVNTTLQTQIQQQSRQMEIMQEKYDYLRSVNLKTDTSKTGTTVVMKYDPVTGNLIERLESRIDELDRSISESRTETHSEATTTVSITETSNATATTAITETSSITATSTVSVAERDKVTIKPGGGGKGHEMRITIGAAYYNNKIKPTAGYTVKALGIGPILSVGPGIVVGDDIVGGAVQADVFDLPRIGVGYGCTFKMKNCEIIGTLGIRLDM